jgi:hypothetical protein
LSAGAGYKFPVVLSFAESRAAGDRPSGSDGPELLLIPVLKKKATFGKQQTQIVISHAQSKI